MQIRDGLGPIPPPDVGMNGIALDRSGADEGDFDGQVVEASGLHAGECAHLGPGLHLEHPDGVGPAQQVVDLDQEVEAGQIDLDAVVLPHQIDHVMEGSQHAQTEEVELDNTGRRAVVLVPLEHAAARHPAPFHRADLDHRAIADHHASRVDAQMPGEIEYLGGQIPYQWREIVTVTDGLTPLHRLGPPVHLLHWMPQGLTYVCLLYTSDA